MSTKLLWSGLTLMMVSPAFGLDHVFVVAGAIIMVIGCVLLWMDK